MCPFYFSRCFLYLPWYNFILRLLIPSLKVLRSKRNRHDPEIRRSDAIWGLQRISKISFCSQEWLWPFSWLESWRESQRGGDWGSFGRGRPRGGWIHILYGLLCDQESYVNTCIVVQQTFFFNSLPASAMSIQTSFTYRPIRISRVISFIHHISSDKRQVVAWLQNTKHLCA